jgi:glycosyltransferase involved in cell wall biosynthesis
MQKFALGLQNQPTPHVLYCHPGVELYGSDRMAVATVAGLVERGWAVSVVVPLEGPLTALFADAGARVLVRNFPVLRKTMLTAREMLRLFAGAPKALVQMIATIREAKADVVYTNTIIQPGWLLASRLARRPSAVHVREAEDGLPVPLQRLLLAPLALARLVLTNSQATRDHVIHRGLHMADKSVVIYNGKDWSSYFRSPYTGAHDPARILFVGRLSPRKGTDIAIRALGELVRNGYDAELRIVGSTFAGYEWYREELDRLVTEYDLASRVSFEGFQADTASFLDWADIVVVPSRAEPFGTVAAESMAAMRPTIVSDVQGLVEIVTDDGVGRTFPNDDHHALAGACAELLDAPNQAMSIAESGRVSVLDRFSLEAYNDAVDARLAALIGASRSEVTSGA